MDYNNEPGSNNEPNNEHDSNDSTNYDSNFNNSANGSNGDNSNFNNGYNNNDFNNDYGNYNNDFNNDFNNSNIETPNPNNGYAIACLILGILSIPLSCCYGLGLVSAIVSIIMGAISKRHNGGRSSGIKIAGFICSIIGMITSILMIVYLIYFFSHFDAANYEELIRELQGSSSYY